MMTDHLGVAALRRAGERWNAGDLDGYLEIYDPGVVIHGYQGVEPGLASARQFYAGFFTAFPGAQLTFEDVFPYEDRVACRFVLRGTHGGPLMGMPATGKAVVMPGITILRFVGNKCVERWSQADFLGLLQQVGAIPTPGQGA
jgi:predicted ester cyclase